MYSNKFRHFQLPFHSCHDIHRIGSAYSDSYHAQSSGIGGMRICTHHHSSRKCIVLQYYLMNNTGTRLPESYIVFRSYTLQEAIHFLVGFLRHRQICRCALVRLNQMIAVYSRRYSHSLLSGIHKLKQCHLCGCILHGYTVRTKIDIILSTAKSTKRLFIV